MACFARQAYFPSRVSLGSLLRIPLGAIDEESLQAAGSITQRVWTIKGLAGPGSRSRKPGQNSQSRPKIGWF